jgi:probable addiction module antidote protein
MKASRPFRDTQIELLKDPTSAALYLEEALIAGDTAAFKLALRNVAEARLGGMSALSERADLNRESLYRTLSDRGNPTLETLARGMRALGLRLSVAVEKPSPPRPKGSSTVNSLLTKSGRREIRCR